MNDETITIRLATVDDIPEHRPAQQVSDTYKDFHDWLAKRATGATA